MSALACALGLAALLVPGLYQEPLRPATLPADRRLDVDSERYYTGAQLETALRALAEAYPEFLRLESMGKSARGRELWVVTAAARDGADPARKSGLLLVGARGADDLHGAEMALFTLFDLVQNHARDPEAARVLAEVALYVVPCLDPDRRASVLEAPEPPGAGPAPAPREVVLDQNFPAGWDPWAGKESGPYPLSEPESSALVAFLAAHPNVAVVQIYAGRAGAPASSQSEVLPDEDLELCRAVLALERERVDDPGHLAAWPDLLLPAGGSLLAHACLERGALGFATEVAARTGSGLPEAHELFVLARRARRHSLLLAGLLPRLALGEPKAQRLKDDTWQIDVELENAGRLPTLGALASQRGAAPPPRVTIGGAKLLAAALRKEGEGSYRPLSRPGSSFAIPEVGGGGRLDLRLVVAAEPESVLELALSAPRAGGAARAIALR